MLKKIFLFLFFVFCLIPAYKFAMAQLPQKGQSSEQVLEGDNGIETPQPYTGGIEEYPYGVEPDQDPAITENATTDSVSPDYTLRENPTIDLPGPDTTLREDATGDTGVTEQGIQESVKPGTVLREGIISAPTGPDTTIREKATDDSDVQEAADPHGAVPDIFAPKKRQSY